MEDRAELLKLAAGALLHDIGKPVQRQGDPYTHKGHDRLGADFLRECGMDNEIVQQAEFHHHSRTKPKMAAGGFGRLCYVTWLADNIASGADRRGSGDESRQPGRKYDSSAPLASVFNLLNCAPGRESPPRYHAPGALQEGGMDFPAEKRAEFSPAAYSQIAEKLKGGLAGFRPTYAGLGGLLELLERTLSFVPSDTAMDSVPDISLYEHSKLTAAIACALYLHLVESGGHDFEARIFRNERAFRDTEFAAVLRADVSGAQDFVYAIRGEGALKTLRARSFYLEMFAENLADEILSGLGLCRANLLRCGGGQFELLLPNTKKARETAGRRIGAANKWLLENFDGALFVADGFSPCSYNSLTDGYEWRTGRRDGSHREIFETAGELADAKKLSRYTAEDIRCLNSRPPAGRSWCKICHKITKNADFCDFCKQLLDFSPRIADRDYFAVLGEETKGIPSIPIMEGQRLAALSLDELNGMDETAAEPGQGRVIRAYGKNKFRDAGAQEPVAHRLWVGDYACAKELSEYAGSGDGIRRIGALRMDVDNLGNAFVSGFEAKYGTIGRTSAVSGKLGMFFGRCVNEILRGIKSRASIVYSGGGDLFLVGAWRDVILAAMELNRAFGEYCAGKLTVSAGIGIFPEKHPIHRIAEITGELEKEAKARGKNRVALFDKSLCFTWGGLGDVLAKLEEISASIAGFGKGMSFAHKLLELARPSAEAKSEMQINVARFVYLLASHAPAGMEAGRRYAAFSDNMLKWLSDEDERKKLVGAMYLYIYKNRKDDASGDTSVQA